MSHSVILVNAQDQSIGVADKLDAHVHGWCHRAFSVQLFARFEGEVFALMQQRAQHKYHCGGLWSNSCCSHFAPGVASLVHVQRRVQEELGLTGMQLTPQGSFHYRAELGNGLIEHEYDHVFAGWVSVDSVPFNPKEVMATEWLRWQDVPHLVHSQPDRFTPWCAGVLASIHETFTAVI